MKITVDFNVNDDASVEAFTGWVNACHWALTEPAILVDTTPEAITSGGAVVYDGIDESGLQAMADGSLSENDTEKAVEDISGDLSGDINGELSGIVSQSDEISKEAQEQHELEKQESQDQAA